MDAKQLLEEYNIVEGILPTYDVIGTIIEDKKGFNILDSDGMIMLNNSYPSLKQLLKALVDNL